MYAPPTPPFRGPKRITLAASIIDFASDNFYHFMQSSFPRLVHLMPLLEEEEGIKLIVPRKMKKKTSFHRQAFELVAQQVSASRLIFYDTDDEPGARFFVQRLFWADSERIRGMGDSTGPTHCLTSGFLLRQAHRAVHNRLVKDGMDGEKERLQWVLIYAMRKKLSMRNFDAETEKQVSHILRKAAEDAGASMMKFEGSKMPMKDAAKLFGGGLRIIVGIHGAALTNAIFAKRGSTLIEFGFRAAVARHYEHLALALGLEYHRILLETDEHAMGSETIRLTNTKELQDVLE